MMAGQLEIKDGPAGAEWASDAIRVRPTHETSLTSIGPHVSPLSGTEYFTYVKVDNNGNEPFGKCSCALTGAWALPTFFINVNPPTNGPNGMVVTVGGGMATLSAGGIQIGQWLNSNGDFWAWSPNNGQFFVYVHRDLSLAASPTWSASMVATSAYAKTPPSPGAQPITVAKGTTVFSAGPTLSASPQAIAGANLGWNAKGTCLVIGRPPLPSQPLTQKDIVWVCPFAGNGPLAGVYSQTEITGVTTSILKFDHLFSPCGDLAGIVPSPVGPLTILDLRTALVVGATVDNLPVSVGVNGNNPTITTTGVGRRGLTLTQVNRSAIDNPECLRGGAVLVDARRVFCSTMPPAMPIVPLSSGASAAAIWPGVPMWVEIPKHRFVRANAAANEHWCLQARGDAAANGDLAPPWSAFAIADRHFAQKNLVIV